MRAIVLPLCQKWHAANAHAEITGAVDTLECDLATFFAAKVARHPDFFTVGSAPQKYVFCSFLCEGQKCTRRCIRMYQDVGS
jgi:hypothetical protein